MTAGDAARWTRVIRRLVLDAGSWSNAVAGRMGSVETALRARLAAEAAGLAVFLVHERLRKEQASAADHESVAAMLRREWESWLKREGLTSDWRALPPGSRGVSEDPLFSGTKVTVASAGHSESDLALEFQRATGLADEALVGQGNNLASLVFYHRVFQAAAAHPLITPSHRAGLVVAARQCRERFQRILRRAPAGHPVKPSLPPAPSLKLLSIVFPQKSP